MTFRNTKHLCLGFALSQMSSNKFQVSRDSRALYITIVTKDRLPVFQKESIKEIACKAIDEARTSGNFYSLLM